MRFQDPPGELVLQISTKNPVFDEYILLGRLTFVIDVQRPAAVCDCAVVHYSAHWARNLLANSSAECGSAFPIEVRFESVAHSFMQQNARPAWPENDGRFSRGRRNRFELHQRLTRGLLREMLRSLLIQEKIEA